jgi:hypothetical protein
MIIAIQRDTNTIRGFNTLDSCKNWIKENESILYLEIHEVSDGEVCGYDNVIDLEDWYIENGMSFFY